MIRGFRGGEFAEKILRDRAVPKGFPADVAKTARRKLVMVNNAGVLADLKSPPGNRLEALRGNFVGRHSVRINDEWRIVFRWTETGPEEVEIVDNQKAGEGTGMVRTLIIEEYKMAKKLAPVHPGEVLREEFLKPVKLTPYAVAASIGVPRTRIERLAREETAVTADTALRLGKLFKTTAAFWLNLQGQYDLETAEDKISAQIKKITSHRAA